VNKKILIIGGGKWQVPIIKKVKSLGYYTICSNLYQDSVGFHYADESFVVDILDKENNLRIANKVNPDGILTDQSDIAVNTVAYLSENMELNGVGTDVADLYTNKFRMREELIVQNLYHPKHKICKSIEEAISFFKENLISIIIKPLASQSSRGVFKINSIEELEKKFNTTMKYSINNTILVEEYIGGIELTVEGFKTTKEHYTLAISKKEHYVKSPSIAKSLTYLNKFDEFDKKYLEDINNKLFDRLTFGITHVEYKYFDGKFYLIEAAIRGGGTKISSHIIPIVSNVDVNELLVRSVLGEQNINIQKTLDEKCVILKFFDFKEGKVLKINGLEYLNNNKNIIDFDFEFKEGDMITAPDDDRSRVGYFIAYSDTQEELIKVVENINNKVYLDYV